MPRDKCKCWWPVGGQGEGKSKATRHALHQHTMELYCLKPAPGHTNIIFLCQV